MIFTGWMNNISSYLNSIPNRQEELDDSSADEDQISEEDSTAENEFPADDFTLIDQYGNEHTLSEYKDKVVFINFGQPGVHLAEPKCLILRLYIMNMDKMKKM